MKYLSKAVDKKEKDTKSLDICSRMLKKADDIGLRNKDQLFFPILEDEHWTLLCVDLVLRKILFFDSLGHHITSNTNDLIDGLTSLFHENKILEEVRSFKVERVKSAKQKNWYDCGIYVFLNIEEWNGKDPPMFLPEDVHNFRKNITMRVLNSNCYQVKLDTALETAKAQRGKKRPQDKSDVTELNLLTPGKVRKRHRRRSTCAGL